MDDLKNRAQKAQTELLEVILQFFKDNPDRCFTGGHIRKRFNLIEGYHNGFPHGILYELARSGKLKKCETENGFKLNAD